MNAFASLPMASAREAPNLEKEICEVICAPLPGDAKDAPEKTCQEICKEGDIITRTRQWIGEKAGPWMEYAKPFEEMFECTTLCGEITKAAGVMGTKLAADTMTLGASMAAARTAIRGACVIPSQIGGLPGYAICMSCCHGLTWGRFI